MTIAAHPVGTGPFRLAEWRRSLAHRARAQPDLSRACSTTREPAADDAEGQALLARVQGPAAADDRPRRGLDHRGSAAALAVVPQRRSSTSAWTSCRSSSPTSRCPNGKLAPNLAQAAACRCTARSRPTSRSRYFNMDDPVVGGYTPEKVALRRAIGLAIDVGQEIRLFWRGQAIPAQSPLMPHTVGYDPDFKSEIERLRPGARQGAARHVRLRRPRRRRLARAARRLAAGAANGPPRPTSAPRQRDELRRKDLNGARHPRSNFTIRQVAGEPEGRTRRQADGVGLGYSAASPDGQPSLASCCDRAQVGGQNLARFRNKEFDRIYDADARPARRPRARTPCSSRPRASSVAYAPYKYHVHRILTDLAQPWVHGYRRPLFWHDWWHYVDIESVEPKGQA